MNRTLSSMLKLAGTGLLLSLAACSNAGRAAPAEGAAPTQAPAQPSPETDHKGEAAKPQAPVDLQLRSTGNTGKITVTLEVKAQGEIKDGRVRFVIPSGITLTQGEKEVALGQIRAGETRQVSVSLDVPAKGSFRLEAGFDAQVSDAIKLHKGKAIDLGGDAPADPTKVTKLPGGGGIRTGK
jgi:hypothetical protein